jgi:hypothetical protein
MMISVSFNGCLLCEALEAEQGKLDEKQKTRIRRRLFEMIALTGMTDPQSERDDLIRSFTKGARAA